ncbi:hypothetical protein DSECCO2_541100 [anaerobic digester metagenome]
MKLLHAATIAWGCSGWYILLRRPCLPVLLLEVGIEIHDSGNRTEEEYHNRDCFGKIVFTVGERLAQLYTQQQRVVSSDQIGGGEGADIAHENEHHCYHDILERKGKHHLKEYSEPAGTYSPGTLDDGLRNT